MLLKQLKKGDFFTLKPIETPNETQVYIKGDYDKQTKSYSCIKFSDISCSRLVKGDKVIYADFTF